MKIIRISKLVIITLIIWTVCLRNDRLNAQQSQATIQNEKASLQEIDNLFMQALSVFPEQALPVEYRSKLPGDSKFKCTTLLIEEVRQKFDLFTAEQQLVLIELLDRPTPEDLPETFLSSSGSFKIHYTVTGGDSVSVVDANSNQVPDYVEQVAQAFETTYNVEIADLGYQKPPVDDENEPEYDVYIEALGTGEYGWATTESNGSYIRIDNDFTNQQMTHGIDGARVTAAHEYFHAVQFGYRVYANGDERFYYELCSTWMEDVVFDDINDYYYFLPPFFLYPNTPFNQFDTKQHYYGEAVWNHFLVNKKADNIDVIRRTWEIMQSDKLAMDAIIQALSEINADFRNEFAEFGVWNYFTGNRADSINFYEEGANYNEITLNGDFILRADTTIAGSSLSLTHKYYRFTTTTDTGYVISGNVDNVENWKFAAIISRPGYDNSIHFFNMLGKKDFGFLPSFSEIVIIPINLLILDGPDRTQLSTKYSTFNFTLEREVFEPFEEQRIKAIYPNPFIINGEKQITFKFNEASTTDLEVRILSSTGRVIKADKLTDGTSFLGSSVFIWNGKNEQNELVPSGIYLFQLKQDNLITIKKFAVIHE